MRLDTPAPHPEVQPPNVHWASIVSDEPIAIHVRTAGFAITEFLRAIRNAEILRQARDQPLCGSVLLLMLDCVNGKELQATGRMIAWPSRAYLAWHTGRTMGHISRAIRELKRLSILKEVEIGGGTKTTRFEMVVPEALPCAPARRESARQRAGSPRASAQGVRAPARTHPARQCEGTLRAGAQQKLLDGKPSIETPRRETICSSSSSSPESEGPQPVGGPAAAAAVRLELEELGLEAIAIDQLLELPTTTRENVLAWSIEGSKGHIQNKAGFVKSKLATTMPPPEKALRLARAKLRRHIAPTPGAETPAVLAVDPRYQTDQAKADAIAFVEKVKQRRAAKGLA